MLVISTTVLTVLAFVVRHSFLQVLFCIASAVCLTLLASSQKKVGRKLFAFAFLTHLAAFYWLPDTLRAFGGFPMAMAIGLHVLFAGTAAFQWLAVGEIYRRLRKQESVLLFPSLYTFSDLIFPQLFPWSFANPIISFLPLSSYAEWIGAKGVSFLLLVIIAVSIKGFKTRARNYLQILGVVALLAGGAALNWHASGTLKEVPSVKVGLVQGNIGLQEKRDEREMDNSLLIHQQLSSEAKGKGAELIVWPETAVLSWTPSTLQSVAATQFDPRGQLAINLLYGVLTYEGKTQRELKKHNGALLVETSGRVEGHYAKQVLMPFGEFLPFETTFPWLRDFSPMTGDFVRGESSAPLLINIGGREVRPVVLICYEDLVPRLSNAGSTLGGNLLVNITNDAWYGDTAAPYQHMLLAQWRTLESGKALIRATNTGVTAFISPRGELVSSLELFKRGVLMADVPLPERVTFYSEWGEIPLIIMAVLGLGISVVRFRGN